MASKEIKTQRKKLPVPKVSADDISIWSILKNSIGKDLSKVAMPVVFNEPLSFLQRITEYMEYSYLLKKANQADDPVERIEYVAAFAVSALASNWERLSKPFNPLLGETYELVREDLGFRIMCEQVSHHPPISAFHADSGDFVFYGTINPKLKYWGRSVEIKPEGRLTVQLLRHKETYSWTNVNCCVHNIIVGKLWFEQYGTMEIVGYTSGLHATIHFKSSGTSGDLHQLEGFVLDSEKRKLRFLYGKWTECFDSVNMADYEEYMRTHGHKFKSSEQTEFGSSSPQTSSPAISPTPTPKKVVSKLNAFTRSFTSDSSGSNKFPSSTELLDNGDIPRCETALTIEIPNSVLLWKVVPRPDYSSEYYHFTLFSMGLNELDENIKMVLPPTDCRLRPDIRKLEEGDIGGAATEKNRLEEKQREARKYRKKKRESWRPRWFKLDQHPETQEEIWLFNETYWQRNFSRCPDIF